MSTRGTEVDCHVEYFRGNRLCEDRPIVVLIPPAPTVKSLRVLLGHHLHIRDVNVAVVVQIARQTLRLQPAEGDAKVRCPARIAHDVIESALVPQHDRDCQFKHCHKNLLFETRLDHDVIDA